MPTEITSQGNAQTVPNSVSILPASVGIVVSSSLTKYPTKKIKETIGTEISELSSDGAYDYLPLPKIKINSPVAGDLMYLDSTAVIKWYISSPNLLEPIDVYYTFDDNYFHQIGSKIPAASTGSLFVNWSQIYLDSGSNLLPLTSSYRITISGSYDNSIISTATGYFSMVTKSLSIIDSPVNVIVVNRNNIFPIKWVSDGIGNYIDLMATTDSPSGNSIGIPIVTNYKNPDTETYYWSVPTMSVEPGEKIYITVQESGTNLYSTSKPYFLVNHFIVSSSGLKTSIPEIKNINAQGLYDYREYAIEILDDVGVAYYPRSYILLDGNIGTPYVMPYIKLFDDTVSGVSNTFFTTKWPVSP